MGVQSVIIMARENRISLFVRVGRSASPYTHEQAYAILISAQLACWPPPSASRRGIVCWSSGNDISYAQLHLEIAIGRAVVVCKEHKAVMCDHIRVVRMSRE